MKKFLYFFVLTVIVFTSCQHKCGHKSPEVNDHLIMAVLFQQKAAEYKALCYQAFNMAEMMLDIDLADQSIAKPRAIVFDIDETLLDNSPYEAKCILEGISYPEQWSEWCNLAEAQAVPGALEFVNKAVEKGYAIIYVTNRKQELIEATRLNMIAAGFPLPSDDFLLMRTDENSKETRRLKIEESYHISMLVGDNLGDFCAVYDGADLEERSAQTDNLKHKFGTRYIVLPNAMYGDWEMSIYGAEKNLTGQQKADIRKQSLQSF